MVFITTIYPERMGTSIRTRTIKPSDRNERMLTRFALSTDGLVHISGPLLNSAGEMLSHDSVTSVQLTKATAGQLRDALNTLLASTS